jgi:hypothetical protein
MAVQSTRNSTANGRQTNQSKDRQHHCPERQKSRIANGSALLSGVDGRTLWVRRCKELLAAHIADLGGPDNCSTAEQSIVRRAAVLNVELERLEQGFALAGEASAEAIDLYARVAANLRRLLESVGLRRRARNVTPTLSEYLASREAAE